jgi:cytochrome P450
VQADHYTLDVYAHEGRLRDEINYIHRSGIRLVDLLFDERILPPDCLTYRREFLGFLERERARSYDRAGWHSLSWRSYSRAVAAAPVSLLHARSLRRFFVSLIFSTLQKVEGPVASPPSHWLFGHQRDFYANPIEFTAKAVGRFRTNIRLKLQEQTYLLVGEQDVDQVLRRNAYNYQPAGISRIVPAFASALLGTPHPRHEPQRRWLASFLDTKAIDAWVPMVGEILKRKMASIPDIAPLDIAPVIRSANFEIASWIILGCDSHDVMERLDHLISKSHSYSTRDLRSFVSLPRWVPLRSRRVVNKVEKEIDGIFHALVSRDKEHSPPSVLHQMLAERRLGRGRSLRDIRYNITGLLLASCEPVAMTTTLALHLLGNDQALQERIVDEFVQAKIRLSALPMNRSELRELVLLNGFIDEVHRLYPAEWLLTREAVHAERLPSGLLVRRGDQVMININCMHRNADKFPDPDRCDPDRFRQRGLKASGTYLPFGAGVTACLGQPLARLIISMSKLCVAIEVAYRISRGRHRSGKRELLLHSAERAGIDPPARKGCHQLWLHYRRSFPLSDRIRMRFVAVHRSLLARNGRNAKSAPMSA